MAAPPARGSADRIAVAAGVLWVAGRILAGRRRATDRHPLAWELPGGKLEVGEDPRAALIRELREELDVDAAIGRVLDRVGHRYEDGRQVEITFMGIRIATVTTTMPTPPHQTPSTPQGMHS